MKFLGSSPLTRGKPSERCVHLAYRRAHPRSRGENTHIAFDFLFVKGSSPLARGKPSACGHADSARGLIPAHAGKTSVTRPVTPACRAHPRSRGENKKITGFAFDTGGSSPLTRGKLGIAAFRIVMLRLIPAHAGKTT